LVLQENRLIAREKGDPIFITKFWAHNFRDEILAVSFFKV